MKEHFALILFILITACTSYKLPQVEVESAAKSWEMTDFIKQDDINPIVFPSTELTFTCPIKGKSVHWEEKNVLNPCAIIKDNKVYLIYRAQDSSMTSRLGLAISEDGLHFNKEAAPIFYPDADDMEGYEWPGGVEDPRIVQSEDGRYILTYTSYNGKIARLCIASSSDLRTWIKHGPVLNEEEYKDTWSKSGAIVARSEGNKIIATKINGLYWMYFGDTALFMAYSSDLIKWTVAKDQENGRMISVLHPRKGHFDSRLVEPGPYALLRDEGIVLIYNASNAANYNDTSLPPFTYAAGQALFDKNLPYKLIDRSDNFFIHPDKDYEKIGEVNEVCFVEGLVHFHNQWFLYYGTADSKIAVAVRSSIQ
jgi:beta-1,2-mannosidase